MSWLEKLDSAFPPSPAQVAAEKAQGVAIHAGYIASPNAYHAWGAAEFGNVLGGGLESAAIWVPSSPLGADVGARDGAGAAQAATAHGCHSVCLDIERYMWDRWGHEVCIYAMGWAAAAHDAGRWAQVYGPIPFLNHLGGHAHSFDAAWVAAYVPFEPTALDPPGFNGGQWPVRGWQWKGSHDRNGLGVDASVCHPRFPGITTTEEPPMADLTPGEIRGLARLAYVAIRPVEPTVGELDGKAATIKPDGSNFDQVLADTRDSPEGGAYTERMTTLLGIADQLPGLVKQLAALQQAVQAISSSPIPAATAAAITNAIHAALADDFTSMAAHLDTAATVAGTITV